VETKFVMSFIKAIILESSIMKPNRLISAIMVMLWLEFCVEFVHLVTRLITLYLPVKSRLFSGLILLSVKVMFCVMVFFFSEAIIRQEKCAGELLYIDAQNKVVDIEKSCSYENRRDLLYELKRDNPYSFVWDIATPIHDSKRARIAYLRYRSPVFNIAYVRPNEVPLIDQVSVKLDRVTVTYGRNNGFRFYKTDRASADTVFTKEFGYRAMIEGNYECDANEFVQLLDHTMLRALLVPEGEGIEAVIKDGYYPYGCVSQHGGIWRTLWYCRMDVDYKSNFTLPRVFQAYVRHIGPYRKKALVLGRGPKIKCSELETEDFFIPAPGQEADEYQTRDGQLNLGVSGAETCHDFQEDIDLSYREGVLDSAPSVIVQ